MSMLDHPNLIRFYGVVEEAAQLNIFVEWMPGGSVAKLLDKHGAFTENVILKYTQQILQGLSYLHSMGIIHRDLKGQQCLAYFFQEFTSIKVEIQALISLWTTPGITYASVILVPLPVFTPKSQFLASFEVNCKAPWPLWPPKFFAVKAMAGRVISGLWDVVSQKWLRPKLRGMHRISPTITVLCTRSVPTIMLHSNYEVHGLQVIRNVVQQKAFQSTMIEHPKFNLKLFAISQKQ